MSKGRVNIFEQKNKTHLHQRLLLLLLLLVQLDDLLEAQHHLHRFALTPAVASLPLCIGLLAAAAAARRRGHAHALRQLLAVAHKVQIDVVAVRAARARQHTGGRRGRGGRRRDGGAAQRRLRRRSGWRGRRRRLAVPHDDGHDTVDYTGMKTWRRDERDERTSCKVGDKQTRLVMRVW